MFGITCPVVYNILKKEDDLRDRSYAPTYQLGKTAAEPKVIEAKNRTHLGPERVSCYLLAEGLSVPPRHYLRYPQTEQGKAQVCSPKPSHPQREA